MNAQVTDIDRLLGLLSSPDDKQRQDAAIALSRIQDARVVAPLIAALSDADSTVRANAASGLGQNRAMESLDALLGCLSDSSEIVRERSVTALAQLGGDRVLDALIDAMYDPSPWVRNRIIYVLGASRDARVVEPLLEALDHADMHTQGVAAWALGSIGDPRALGPLRELLSSKQAALRGNAAWSLGELGDPSVIPQLIRMLKDKDPEVRGKTAWALGALGESSGRVEMVRPLIELLDDFTEIKSQAAHVFVCQYAAEALVQIGSEVAQLAVGHWRERAQAHLLPHRIREQIKKLNHADPRQRELALTALVQIGPDAVEPLLKALSHQSTRIRQGAVRVLGQIRDARALPGLMQALGDSDAGVWSQAAAALAQFGEEAHAPLSELMQESSGRVRTGAAVALWRSQRDEAAFRYVLTALHDEELLVRSSALTSLTQQPDERALASIQILLSAGEEILVPYTLQALKAMDSPGAQASIRHWLRQKQDDNPENSG